jgi:hypothetical protein
LASGESATASTLPSVADLIGGRRVRSKRGSAGVEASPPANDQSRTVLSCDPVAISVQLASTLRPRMGAICIPGSMRKIGSSVGGGMASCADGDATKNGATISKAETMHNRKYMTPLPPTENAQISIFAIFAEDDGMGKDHAFADYLRGIPPTAYLLAASGRFETARTISAG